MNLLKQRLPLKFQGFNDNKHSCSLRAAGSPCINRLRKQAIGVQLLHEQVKRLTDKEVEKNQKRYEAYVGGKTTETLIDSFLMLTTTAIGMFLPIKNVEALRNDYRITNEMSTLDGNLALKYHTVVDVASILV